MIFKVLVDMKSCHGGEAEWSPGEWRPAVSPQCCNSGYHLTSDPLRWWKPRASLWIAEFRGEINGDGSDKAAFAEARITEQVTRDWPLLVMFPRVRAFLAASVRSEDKNANLSWANLSGANLSGANLSWANLSGANLSWAYRPTSPPPGWRVGGDGRLARDGGAA